MRQISLQLWLQHFLAGEDSHCAVQSTSGSVYFLSCHGVVLGWVLTCAIHTQQGPGWGELSKILLRVRKFLWGWTPLLSR